ncbi:MAG TPA: COR domain-containing protein [Verrucomicrobiae bacterium]|nr:COR domain-containing protein [Verrucomicrobiae bacterium]
MPEQHENEGWQEALRRIEEARQSNARTLDLNLLKLTALPESLSQLTSLEELSLNTNQLTAIPEFLSQLGGLKSCDFSTNQLTTLPESLGRLAKLVFLNININKIKVVPEYISQFANLTILALGGNQLTSLPNSLGRLSKLTKLYLFSNLLVSVPKAVGDLTSLEHLDLSSNHLTALPESFRQLADLRELDLGRNQLTAIPEFLTTLPNLTRLFLHGNPGLGIPNEILGPTWDEVIDGKEPKPPKEIFEYIFSKRRPLNEAKLILVGQGGVGKTSLVKTLTGQKFKTTEKTTQGIKIKDWSCPLHNKSKGNVTVHIWDFGGQEMMHATHQFFLTPRSLYLLVLNWRPGAIDREADYWFRLIRSSGGEDAPVIVVLNKQKEGPFDVNQGGWLQKYAGNIRGFVKTDCENAKSITSLKRKIQEELQGMKSLETSFPERWFAVKDELSQMSAQFVTYEDYRKICAKYGEKDPDKQTSLAGFLHDLGIALNYKDDPRLRFAYVLKPEWVTEGIYAILHAFKKSKGLFTRAEASGVLGPGGYATEAVDFILGLMDQFEVSFPLGDSQKRSLIPQLLEDQQPDEAGQFDAAKCLNFGYKYEIVPEGLLPRFIVRTHHISEAQGRWKSGVILHDPDTGCRALIKADSIAGQVSIQVDGPEQTRRELLAIIRYNFQVIHADSKLKPAELVYPPGVPERPQRLDDLHGFLSSGAASTVPIMLPDNTVITPTVASLIEPVKTNIEPLRLFLSYSHKDKKYVDELRKALKPTERNGLIQPWYDGEITAGEEWKPLIEQRLRDADIIVCQLSRDFLDSDFCVLNELETAIQRREAGEAGLVAYVLHDCDWKETKVAKFQILPSEAKAIDGRNNKHKYWTEIADGIKAAVKKLRGQLPLRSSREGRRGMGADR